MRADSEVFNFCARTTFGIGGQFSAPKARTKAAGGTLAVISRKQKIEILKLLQHEFFRNRQIKSTFKSH
jgi:hypothetical protein